MQPADGRVLAQQQQPHQQRQLPLHSVNAHGEPSQGQVPSRPWPRQTDLLLSSKNAVSGADGPSFVMAVTMPIVWMKKSRIREVTRPVVQVGARQVLFQ